MNRFKKSGLTLMLAAALVFPLVACDSPAEQAAEEQLEDAGVPEETAEDMTSTVDGYTTTDTTLTDTTLTDTAYTGTDVTSTTATSTTTTTTTNP